MCAQARSGSKRPAGWSAARRLPDPSVIPLHCDVYWEREVEIGGIRRTLSVGQRTTDQQFIVVYAYQPGITIGAFGETEENAVAAIVDQLEEKGFVGSGAAAGSLSELRRGRVRPKGWQL